MCRPSLSSLHCDIIIVVFFLVHYDQVISVCIYSVRMYVCLCVHFKQSCVLIYTHTHTTDADY